MHGTQAWGIRDFDAYQPTAVTHYKIPVGAFYTGTYDFLIFANDHDVTPGTAESWFSNVKVYEEPAATDYTVDFSAVQVLPFGSNDVNSTMAVEDGGASLRITGNGWKKLPIRTEVTPDTVLEFDFSSPAQAEVQGIGFDNDEGITSGQTFRVYGTQNWGIADLRQLRRLGTRPTTRSRSATTSPARSSTWCWPTTTTSPARPGSRCSAT